MPAHNFHPGDAVVLANGNLKGLEGVFLGPAKPSARVKVLLHFLGSLREAEVDAHSLDRAGTGMAPRERGTRGKGRKINRPPAVLSDIGG